jgi:uncharacterized protein (DUF1810 family)
MGTSLRNQFDLARFVRAQDAGDTYARALTELRTGRKVSHWMWFVFPQLAGLGRSAIARQYAITSLDEAKAYLAHDVLGSRLLQCSEVVAALEGLSAEDIFGTIDAMKLRSSATLFGAADPHQPIFGRILDIYFDGRSDPETLRLIGPSAGKSASG